MGKHQRLWFISEDDAVEMIRVPPGDYQAQHRAGWSKGEYGQGVYNDHYQEHLRPESRCRAPMCKDTNWGGYGRLHIRSEECPPYSPDPEPNVSAEGWEAIRQWARGNAERKRQESSQS